MRSVNRRFKKIVNKNPLWSDYICFVESIKEQGFTKRIIRAWFSKLVSNSSYDKKDKKRILNQLYNL